MAALNSKVKKAVIPVAGLGTRMLPATKAIPKEMLPLVDKPLIQYVVNECIAAGITEIVLVTHSSKNSIENHFDTSFELEAMLEKRVKRQLLEEVQSICPPHVTIMQVRQGLAKGLGHAVLCAHPVVGNEPVAVILPDVILDEYESDLSQDNLAEMIRRFDETGNSQIMVEPVEDVTAYGVVDCKGVELAPGESVPMVGVVEKPKADVAPSNLAIVGRYVLSADIWALLAKTPPGAGDEIQLTDAIDMLIEKETVEAYHMKGKSHDCGNKLGYMQAFVEYGIRHNSLGAEFKAWLEEEMGIKKVTIRYKFFNRSAGKSGAFFMPGVVSGELRQKKSRQRRDFKHPGSKLFLDQEIFQLLTLFFHCFFDYSRCTTLASPGFSFTVFVNIAIFSRTSCAFSFGTGFSGSHAIQQFIRVNAVGN